MMALAPIGTACVYHLNAFGITDIYPVLEGGNSRIFLSDLVNNFFLLYSAIYFLHLSLTSFIKKEYHRILQIAADPEKLIEKLQNYQPQQFFQMFQF